MLTLSGVYEIRNTLNGHRYIGSSTVVTVRMHRHKIALEKCGHGNRHLQRAWDKYGSENFVLRPILYCDLENALLYEQMCLDAFHPEYNIAIDARASGRGLQLSLGRVLSDETKERISNEIKGWWQDNDEARLRLSERRTGSVASEETRQKQRESNHGISAETRLKMADTLRGVPKSEEHRRKIGDAHRGSHHTEEHKQKISKSLMGNQRTLGYSPSEETRKKMSIAQKKRWGTYQGEL